MDINSLSTAPLLLLGHYDQGLIIDRRAYLSKYHQSMSTALQNMLEFRDEHKWRPFTPVPGQHVRTVQTFLKTTGFMPNHEPDGIYGYETVSGVRLFQEYMRTFKGVNMMPDGKTGHSTFSAMIVWQNQEYGVCEWAEGTASVDHAKWLDLLVKRKAQMMGNPIVPVICREQFTNPTDTRKVADWEVSADGVHLIGIRRNLKKTYLASSTDNDLFVLLVNGMVFQFFGSTIPNPSLVETFIEEQDAQTNKTVEIKNYPFLLEGQHLYQLGWHKRSIADQVYEAWRPAKDGIMIYRRPADFHQDNIIEDQSLMQSHLDKHGNTTINIHWSGRGSFNFSAGCQVIGGSSYFNNKGALIDDGNLATVNKHDLDLHHTKAAYNMLVDLITCYTTNEVRTLAYSLVRDETLYELEDWTSQHIANLEAAMLSKVHHTKV